MASTPSRRTLLALVPLAVVAVVVAAVLLVGGADDEPEAAPSASPSSTSATPTPTETSPDEFCVAFRAFAEASNELVAMPDDPAAQQTLRETARVLVDLPPPVGLSPGGEVSLDALVGGSLAALGETVEPESDVPADDAAFNDYLAATCPA